MNDRGVRAARRGITLKIGTPIIVMFALLGPGKFVAAQESADAEPPETIIVTATRNEMTLRQATVPVTVISREQIEQSLATDLAELLRFEAGLDIGRNGGPGQATSLFLRGTESNHTLVLVDGVRINPGTLGGAPIQHIAPELIEQVEIVKGARSALYGTDAIGGVINIITRRPVRSSIEASVGGGSFDSRSGFVNGALASESGELGATLNWNATDGYAIRTDSDVERGYENLSVNLYGMRRFGRSSISFRHWQTNGNVEYLDFFLSPRDQDFSNQSTSLELRNAVGDSGQSRLLLSYFVDDIQQNQADDFVRSRRASVDWQYSMQLDSHKLTGGLYLVEENATSLSFGSGFDEDTGQQAVFLQDHIALGRHNGFLAVRLTDHETFGSEPTWNVEYVFDIDERWSLSAGMGHAFRAPDATDRFGFGGSIDLRPELADEYQAGIGFRPTERQRLRLEIYRNDITDLIEFPFPDFTAQNIGKAEIRGAQLGYELLADSFSLRADFIRQTAENGLSGARLLRRPEQSLTVNYVQRIGAHRAGISLLASGDREDLAGTLPGYALVNLTGQLQLASDWQLNARIENVFDRAYQTASPYRMQERSAFVELKFRWE